MERLLFKKWLSLGFQYRWNREIHNETIGVQQDSTGFTLTFHSNLVFSFLKPIKLF